MYRNTDVAITLAGQKINPLTDILGLGIQTTGNVVFVEHPSDADFTTVREAVGGRSFLYDTIQKAIDSSKVRSGKNDFIIVCPRDNNSSWVASGTPAGIVLNKHNVHLLGLGAGKSFGSASVIVEQPGTAGTSVGGTLGDGGDGGIVTINAGVSGLDLHDFKIEKTGIQWDAGTTGITGTPTGDIAVGSAAKNITIRDGYILSGTGLKASASHGIDLQFNNTNIRVFNVEFVANKDAAAGRFIDNSPGTANNAISLIVDRCKFYNTSGTAISSAVAGTMGVGLVAMIHESMAVGATQVGTAGSTFVAPVYGTSTVVKNPYLGIGTAALVSA